MDRPIAASSIESITLLCDRAFIAQLRADLLTAPAVYIHTVQPSALLPS